MKNKNVWSNSSVSVCMISTKEALTKSGKVRFVQVPKDVTWWEFSNNEFGNIVTETLSLGKRFLQYGKRSVNENGLSVKQVYFHTQNFFSCQHYKEATIIGKLSELTDEQCEEFVDFKYIAGCDPVAEWSVVVPVKVYIKENSEHVYSAKECFISLLQLEGLNPAKEYLIIKVE